MKGRGLALILTALAMALTSSGSSGDIGTSGMTPAEWARSRFAALRVAAREALTDSSLLGMLPTALLRESAPDAFAFVLLALAAHETGRGRAERGFNLGGLRSGGDGASYDTFPTLEAGARAFARLLTRGRYLGATAALLGAWAARGGGFVQSDVVAWVRAIDAAGYNPSTGPTEDRRAADVGMLWQEFTGAPPL